MDIYALVHTVCKEQGIVIDTAKSQMLVGTLRMAGFSLTLSDKDVAIARNLIERRLLKEQPRVAAVSDALETPISSVAQFQEINSFRSKNKCPRCKDSMESVKLANYEKANYCARCKVALWAD